MSDVGWASNREAEHAFDELAEGLGDEVVSACTHVAASTHPDATPAVVLTVEVAGGGVRVLGGGDPDAATHALDDVAARHEARRGGRAFVFGGHLLLRGPMSVGELVAASAVDEVVMIGQRDRVADDVVIDTQSFVRPTYDDGVLRLVVRPAPGGTVVPFEQPDPTPCCADH
ncbi:MAG TPA: hypothetical protein VF661_01470 [Actinomycetales bacterium]|jgi:hypothetical protein